MQFMCLVFGLAHLLFIVTFVRRRKEMQHELLRNLFQGGGERNAGAFVVSDYLFNFLCFPLILHFVRIERK